MLTTEDIRQYLYREARYLDDKQWDDWLALYAPAAQFWMPSWDDDDKLVTDPLREVSLIYYPHKGGLEDRVFRIRTERRSLARRTTSATWKSPGRRRRSASCGSTGSR